MKQITADLETAQAALRNIITILEAINGGHPNPYYEIGRGIGAAKMGLIESGGKR